VAENWAPYCIGEEGGGAREAIPHSITDAKLKKKLKSRRSLISLSDPRKTLFKW